MELDRLKILADRYFEAETTLEEEQELKEYLATAESIPEEYAALKIMLGVAAATQEVKAPKAERDVKRRNLWMLRMMGGMSIAAAAAAIIFMLVTPYAALDEVSAPKTEPSNAVVQQDLICYVDGVRLTDMDAAYSQANKILGGVSNDLELAMAQVNKFNIQGIK